MLANTAIAISNVAYRTIRSLLSGVTRRTLNSSGTD